jgi:phospholipid/cholesterol/gamma-HCH transport system substrate-binding protein
MSVRDDIHLPKDSSAEVTSESLLGGKFLNLSPGGDTTDLPPGGTITITQSSVSLEQLLGKFIFSAASLTDKSKSNATDQEAPK